MSIYSGSVKRPILTSLCFVAVMIFGLFSLHKLPIDLYPHIEMNTIMVITSYQGASAADIENNISRPLENVLNTVSDLKHITSKSKENISIISMEFEYGKSLDVLTNDVRDKLDLVRSYLPEGSENPTIFKFSTDMIPVVILSAQAKESLPALYKILDEGVANPLARINGVGTVSVTGAPKREIHIYIDPIRLEAYHLTVEQISAVVAAENKNVPGGSFDIGSNTYSLRVQGEFDDSHQINNIVVGSSGGRNIYLKDVARIEDSVKERSQETYNNGVQGAQIVIQKQTGANTVDIANKVHAILPSLQAKLPSDVKLDVVMDSSDNIKNTINSLGFTIRDALIFVGLVVFFFLGKWRSSVIILLTIPLSLVASFIYLAATGSSLNIISLSSLSIAIGLVVDDAIVVLENVTTHIERGSDPKQAAVHGTNEMALSVVASTLTLFAVFFPLTLVTGMTGVLFRELGWMVCIIMAISLICAMTLTPMLCGHVLKADEKTSKTFQKLYAPIQRFLDNLDAGYARLLEWCVRRRKRVMLGSLLFFIFSLFLFIFIGTEFMPVQDNARVGVTIELPVGSRTEVSKEIASQVEKLWEKKYPEIEFMNFTVGQAESDNTWAAISENGSHIVAFNIRLSDPYERKKGLAQICEEMRNDLAEIPEIKKFDVSLGGNKGGTMGGQSTLNLEVYGYDFAATDKVAKELKAGMSKVKGCSDIKISRGDYQPEYQIKFDREKLALNGLNLFTAATFARNRINGAIASKYRENGDEYDIKVMYAPENRQSVEAIENIMVYNSQGKGIRIKDLGKVVEESVPPTIERKDRERINTVQAVISGESMDKVVSGAKEQIKQLDIPAGVNVKIAGTYEEQQESFSDLGILAVLIVLLVFIVMAAEFESLTYPFVIMLSIPFSMSGVLLALAISGTTFNLMSVIGMIMLIGIVVKNGIVLVDYINLNRERGQGIISAVVAAGQSRLRPVLMTTLTAILGMVPMAMGNGQGAEMWKPMGVAIIGGLTISTLFTLTFIPTVYCAFAGFGVRRKRKSHTKRYTTATDKDINLI